MILRELPEQYYGSLKPATIEEAIRAPGAALSVVKKEAGEAAVLAFLVITITDVVDFINVSKTMGAKQIIATARMIADDYYYLKPEDFKLCFNNAKKGVYGKLYDRIDGQIMLDWIERYCAERANVAAIRDDADNGQAIEQMERDVHRIKKVNKQINEEIKQFLKKNS